MLGWILVGLVGAALATAIVVYVSGTITRSKLRQKAIENEIKSAVVEKIDRCNNIVKIKDLKSDKELEIHGDDIDDDVDEDDVIRI